MTEVPRRLVPSAETTRNLYLRSGNRCAYPGCEQPLMTSDGILVGEIAHIEAPVPGGPRFRASMTNEECRSSGNLLLMCGTHHTIVDKDVDRWTVERLQELKEEHERIYTGAIDRLRSTVGVITEHAGWRPAANLRKLLNPNDFSPQEHLSNLQTVNGFAKRLAAVPVGARSVLALIIARGNPASGGSFEEVSIPMPVLDQVADCSTDELIVHLQILEHFELAYIDPDSFEGPVTVVAGNSMPGIGWPLLHDLQEMPGAPEVIRQVLVDLDFTAFDS